MMTIDKIYAHISCSDLSASTDWYRRVFGRPPDATPMAGLAEWHHSGGAGLQVFEDAAEAGHQTLTLIVRDLRGEHKRLGEAGVEPGEIEPAEMASIIRLRDPDGNLVVLAQAGRV